MTDHTIPSDDIEDIEESIRAGRPLRQARAYRIRHADENLDFQPVLVNDPLPTGRQILQAIGLHPVEEISLFAILADRSFEDVNLDGTFDLRGRGAERFIHFRSDRDYRFTLDDRQVQWGKPSITGRILKLLAGVDPVTYDVYLDVRGGHDRLIGNDENFALDTPGVERFVTLIRHTTEGSALLPERDRRYLANSGYAYEVLQENGSLGVVLKDFPLPEGKFLQATADTLIMLPGGYPDACPDMFFMFPTVTLAATGTLPRATQGVLNFSGRSWQQWSRHSGEWRPGIDGVHTMVNRALNALREAA
jgi:hypothetical protein